MGKPPSEKRVLALLEYPPMKLLGKTAQRRVWIIAMWVPGHTRPIGDYDELEGEYDEATEEYYWAEGWYECIESWEDLGYLAVDSQCKVVRWMDLPKMEAE